MSYNEIATKIDHWHIFGDIDIFGHCSTIRVPRQMRLPSSSQLIVQVAIELLLNARTWGKEDAVSRVKLGLEFDPLQTQCVQEGRERLHHLCTRLTPASLA